MKKSIKLLMLFMLSACTSNSPVFTEFMDKDKVCDLFSDELIKTTFNIDGDIQRSGKFSDSFYKGFIGNLCVLSWGISEEEQESFSFALVSLKNNEVFPPKKLNEKQLLKKIEQVNKSMESSLSGFGQALIDRTQRNTADGIRSQNDYKILNELGDSAIITKLVINDYVYMQSMALELIEKQEDIILYTLSIKSGNIMFKTSLSTEVINNPKDKLIQLMTHTFNGK